MAAQTLAAQTLAAQTLAAQTPAGEGALSWAGQVEGLRSVKCVLTVMLQLANQKNTHHSANTALQDTSVLKLELHVLHVTQENLE